MVQVKIIQAFGPGALEKNCNEELRKLDKNGCVIYRVERVIYDVVNEIYTLLIVYQEPPKIRVRDGK